MERVNLNGIERIIHGNLCSGIHFVDLHIEKHGFKCDMGEYMEIGQKISNGSQGIFSKALGNRKYTVVVSGFIEHNGRYFGILRSVRFGEDKKAILNRDIWIILGKEASPLTCIIHGTIPYAHGFCPFCN